MTTKSVFKTLSAIDVNGHTDQKGNLTYLSWTWAWAIAKENYPDMSYRVVNFDGKPYCFDENLGYMVQTEVTIQNEMLPMHLFVMDGANKARRHIDYEYLTRKGKQQVVAATMFDINTAIMRCLTKNLALFGLGHYIYAGEDLPRIDEDELARIEAEKLAKSASLIKSAKTINELVQHWQVLPKAHHLKLVKIKDEMKEKLSKEVA